MTKQPTAPSKYKYAISTLRSSR